METLLSYFYSTIPQVLSGTIALFGVFSLYKLNLIKNELRGLAESMAYEIENGNYPDEVKTSNKDNIRRLKIGVIQGNPYKMKSSLDRIFENLKHVYPNSNMNEQIIAPFELQFETRNDLIKHTKFALIYTGFIIFITILTIPFIRGMLSVGSSASIIGDRYNCLAIILLIVIILLFLFNLILIIWIIFRSLDTYREIRNI